MIRVGIGGWNFEPWRGTFFPEKHPKTQELAYASSKLTSIEINATFYRTQKPSTFRKWADETPADFMFSVKAPQYATNRKVLAEAGPMIDVFLKSGLSELGPKLGPLFWQMAPTKKFDPDDFGPFLKLLPPELKGQKLRHAVEARHESFRTPAAVELMRKAGVAFVIVESEKAPMVGDVTGDFVYLRLQKTEEKIETGYAPAALKKWAERLKSWESGKEPGDLPLADKPGKAVKGRDVFCYFISGAKVRAPAAAMAMLKLI